MWVEQTPVPPYIGGTMQQIIMTAPLDPPLATSKRVETNNIIKMTPYITSSQPPQTAPGLIRDNIEIMPPEMHTYDVSTIIEQQ